MVWRNVFGFFILFNFIFPATAATDIWLRLQGSNTVGARLGPLWAKAFLEQRGIQQVRIESTLVDNEFLVSGIDPNNAHDRVGISVAAHGTATGFAALAAGQTDIAMASRPIKPEEQETLHPLGDMESIAAEHAVGIDGVAILVHPTNPLTKLTRAQIAALFSGAITNWRELGGPNRAVTVYSRDERSGTWETFRDLVLGKTYPLSKSAQLFESSDKLSDAVSADPGAIGFTGLASIRTAKAIAVADGVTQALTPTRLTVATEDYALSRRLFLYIPPQSTKPLTREFVAFCQSHEGQQRVDESGFVSQNVDTINEVVDAHAPLRYRNITAKALRLSLNFRFKNGNSLLDNKALQDVERLSRFLKKPENLGQRVYLIGFSESERRAEQSQIISRFRALAVRAALMQRDVPVFGIEGFGDYKPIVDNPELAAVKNGRVEVWLAPDR